MIREGARRRTKLLYWILGIALANCSVPEPGVVTPDQEQEESRIDNKIRERGSSASEESDPISPDAELRKTQRELRRPLPERVEPRVDPALTGEVPAEILEALSSDLIERTGTERETIEIVRAEETIWPDGSLGCPRPDTTYPQAPVKGFRIVMVVAGIHYDYRVTRGGSFFLCQSGVAGTGLTPPARPANR